MKETKEPVGIRNRLPRISIADQEAEGRGLAARVGEETVKVKLMLLADNYHSGAVACSVPTYHIHQSHIKEHASCDGEDPAGDIVCVLAHSCANQHANVGHEGGQQIVDDGLLHRHPRFEQHRKVTCQPGETRTHLDTIKRKTPAPVSYSDTHIPTCNACDVCG